jgi:glutamate/tyrosine decarboxylase-like PLP-dependent enzyme
MSQAVHHEKQPPRESGPSFPTLDFSKEQLNEYLHDAADIVARLYSDLGKRKLFEARSVAEVSSKFDEPLPRRGVDMTELLTTVERDVFGNATLNISPNFYAYVMSGGNHVGMLAELLCAALNQNTGKWHLGAAAAEMERRVIQWIAEFIGYPTDTGGVLVSGGSAASLTCLKAARDCMAPFDVTENGCQSGTQLIAYVSKEGHSCLDKSMDMLGIGKKQLRKIPVLDDFTIDIVALKRSIEADKRAGLHPFCIIGNGGTVNTGAIDPLVELADIAEEYQLWFHLDAAYGAPAAATRIVRNAFDGLSRADSIALDAHKWLYVPFEGGCALVRDRKHLRNSFSVVPDYLRSGSNGSERFDFMEYNFQLSRNFKALKIWMTFKAYGSDLLRDAIESNIKVVRHLASLIEGSRDFERLAPVPLSIVCFRYRTEDVRWHSNEDYLSLLNKKILEAVEADGRVFLTGTIIHGKTSLRACCVNHRTEVKHIEYLFKVLREIGEQVHKSIQRGEGGAGG